MTVACAYYNGLTMQQSTCYDGVRSSISMPGLLAAQLHITHVFMCYSI